MLRLKNHFLFFSSEFLIREVEIEIEIEGGVGRDDDDSFSTRLVMLSVNEFFVK